MHALKKECPVPNCSYWKFNHRSSTGSIGTEMGTEMGTEAKAVAPAAAKDASANPTPPINGLETLG